MKISSGKEKLTKAKSGVYTIPLEHVPISRCERGGGGGGCCLKNKSLRTKMKGVSREGGTN